MMKALVYYPNSDTAYLLNLQKFSKKVEYYKSGIITYEDIKGAKEWEIISAPCRSITDVPSLYQRFDRSLPRGTLL